MVYVISACCVLHNFIITEKGVDEDDMELADDDHDDGSRGHGQVSVHAVTA